MYIRYLCSKSLNTRTKSLNMCSKTLNTCSVTLNKDSVKWRRVFRLMGLISLSLRGRFWLGSDSEPVTLLQIFYIHCANPREMKIPFEARHGFIIENPPSAACNRSPMEDSINHLGKECHFSHLSNQLKKVRCQRMPFWGFSTQWFSSG